MTVSISLSDRELYDRSTSLYDRELYDRSIFLSDRELYDHRLYLERSGMRLQDLDTIKTIHVRH